MTNLPVDLVKVIRDELSITTFIETGTGLGKTTEIVADLFEKVYTIEAHKGRWLDARVRFKIYNGSVQCIHGNSAQELPKLLEKVSRQCIFFLDAHCGYRECVTDSACVVTEEINAILGHSDKHIIIIDDFWWFNVPPNDEYGKDYPELPLLMRWLNFYENSFIFVFGAQCLISVPRQIECTVKKYIQSLERCGWPEPLAERNIK